MKFKYSEFLRVSRLLIYLELSVFGKAASPYFGAGYAIESETKV